MFVVFPEFHVWFTTSADCSGAVFQGNSTQRTFFFHVSPKGELFSM